MNRLVVALTIAGAFGVVVAASVATYVSVVSPLEPGSSWGMSGAETAAASVTAGAEREYWFEFVDSGVNLWAVEVRNALPIPVTVRGIQDRFPPGAPVVSGRPQLPSGSSLGFEPEHLKPFTPLELAPGETVFLVIEERFKDCPSARETAMPGTAAGQGVLHVDVSVLGVPKTARVELPFAVFFKAPDEQDC